MLIRLSRFNARAWSYRQLFETPRARRITIAAAATLVGVIGAVVVWPSSAAPGPAARKSVNWKAFAPPKKPAPAKPRPAPEAPPSVAANLPAGMMIRQVKPPASVATPAEQSNAPAAPVVRTAASNAPRAAAPARRTAVAASATTRPAAVARPVAKSAPAAPAIGAGAPDSLGPLFIDEHNGFSMRFPVHWKIRTFGGEGWVLDSGDVKVGLISVGFSPFPPGFTAENIPASWVAKRIQKRGDTVLHAQGYATIGGRRALWNKSTGPLPMSNGTPRMTRVNYILPLDDGRVMELRVAAAPENFNKLVPLMKKAVETFRFAAPIAPSATVKSQAAVASAK